MTTYCEYEDEMYEVTPVIVSPPSFNRGTLKDKNGEDVNPNDSERLKSQEIFYHRSETGEILTAKAKWKEDGKYHWIIFEHHMIIGGGPSDLYLTYSY